jgi:hypothetical protein
MSQTFGKLVGKRNYMELVGVRLNKGKEMLISY